MRAKLLSLAAATVFGVALPIASSAAVTVTTIPPALQPVPGVPVAIIYPGAAIETPLYRFIGDDHRQIQIRAVENWSYRFIDAEHRQVEVFTMAG